MPRPTALLSAAAIALAPAAVSHAQAITVESRDSTLTVAPFNLGYNPGSGGGDPGALVGTSSLVDSAADLGFAGNLFYGPDSFGRTNAGTYDATQDVTFTPTTLSVLMDQTATQSGTASPIVQIDNFALIYFSVDADTDANLAIELDGDTNTGKDKVSASLREIDAMGNHVAGIFTTFSNASTGSDTLDFPLTLEAGARYELRMTGEVRVISSTSNLTSRMHATLTVPEPASAAALALLATPLLRRRR